MYLPQRYEDNRSKMQEDLWGFCINFWGAGIAFFQDGGRGEGLTAHKKRCWLFGRGEKI